MKFKQIKKRRTAQEIQDDIFRTMSADRKIDVGSQLWRLAKELVGNKINYNHGTNRSATPIGENRQTS
ncbi:MAG: hypothetical protein HY764_01505 [Candidatus Portnoybacteria bacterium]|nr:hypothetical protein [Candidatus Portnoybacteria bacterium]